MKDYKIINDLLRRNQTHVSMKMKRLAILFVFFCVICLAKAEEGTAHGQTKSKTVSTLLNAKWNSTPTALEIAEFLNDEDSAYFWSFLEDLNRNEDNFSGKTDKRRYEILLDLSRKYLSDAQISMMKFSLGLHVYSPKIEMFQQIAMVKGVQTKGCDAVAEVNGILECDPSKISSLLNEKPKHPELYKLDHQYPGKVSKDRPVVILYGQIGSKNLKEFHVVLKKLADSGDILYVVRHYINNPKGPKVRLSGYGVELQIKSTEYKAQDDTKVTAEQSASEENVAGQQVEDEDVDVEGFLFSKLKVLNPDLAPKLDKLKQALLDESQELAPLKVWQLQELSLQAAERILSAARDESLKVMAQLAQNFPLLARSLVRTTVRPGLKAEIKRNQQRFASDLNLQPSEAALFINGQHFNVDAMDVFTLFDQLREEVKLVEGLHRIGVPSQYVSSLLSLDLSPPSRQYAVDIRDSAVLFINDIEKDPQYRRWSPNIQDLLRPSYPGALRSIRRNMYNLVLVVDPVLNEARSIIKLAESFVVHNAPLRVGLVLAVNSDTQLSGRDDAGVAILNAFNYVSQRSSSVDGLSFITDLFALVDDKKITVDDVGKLLKKKFNADLEEVLGEDSDYDVGRQLTKDFLRRTGFRKLPQVLLNGVALDENSLNGDEFEEAVLTELMRQTSSLQKALFKGEMKEDDNVIDFLMSQPNVMPRLNDRVLSTTAKFVDMTGTVEGGIQDLSSLSSLQLVAALTDSVSYVSSNTKALTPITIWLVADVTQKSGRDLVLDAIEYVRNSRLIRLTLIHNPESLTEASARYIDAIDAVLSSNDLKLLAKLLKPENVEALMSGSKASADLGVEPAQKSSFGLELHQLVASRVLGFQPGQRGLVANGRIIGPLNDDEDFTTDDIALLEKHTMSNSGDKILQFTQDLPQLHSSDLVMKVSGLLLSSSSGSVPKTRHNIDERGSELSVLHFPPKFNDSPFIDITAVVDPLSVGAQKVAPLLLVLQEVLNCRVRVFLNPVEKNSEMPLNSFYRLVLEPDLMFGSDERQLPGPTAKFGILPMGALLTQGMQVPDNWLVESVWSPYDLDNIRLRDVDTDVHSEYELEHLILEGHCFDSHSGSPPRGLQLTLGTPNDPLMVDTIVMANLGYLQLKANPGSWILRLREGRSSEIYDIISHEGTDTPSSGGSGDIHVLISSFKSHVMKLKVAKKPGKQQMDLLSTDDDDNSGLWNSITSTFSAKSSDEDEDKLNIFSLASGHLYERFIRIMMLSVLKHTKTPVKFWFLKQYLSPTLKDFLPHMAAQYGFEYELVQYKWPRWLHQQKEKQRIIWGYKILFLDVLFPLSIKKIIFVDADQIVRTDLKELRDLDLGGAPYGYTPFCDSRREMDGFRFWKSGYWRNHLQGRKYHISALYVVDLKRFRKIAAGDRLRGQYQALSQDPNSLSNLDQDLPNNMIHQVPIKSLPQEWLWCETWCDDTSKKKAKTIDLCNNPQTKEAKLDAAVRIVAEWNDYDTEIKSLQETLARNRTEHQRQHDPSEF